MLIDAYFELQYKAFEFQQDGIRHDCCDEHLRQLGLTVTLPHGVQPQRKVANFKTCRIAIIG